MGKLSIGAVQSLRYDPERKVWLTRADICKKTPSSGASEAKSVLRDGDGLNLHLTPAGGMTWRIEYRFRGVRKSYTVGPAGQGGISLAEARDALAQVKRWIRDGTDPSEIKRAESGTAATTPKFADVVADWFKKRKSGLSEDYRKYTWRRIENHILPNLGETPVADVRAPDILHCLQPLEVKGLTETVHKCVQIIAQVLDYAQAAGMVEFNVAARIVRAVMPSRHRHRPAITDPTRLGQLLRDIDKYHGDIVVRRALQVMPYVFVRAIELTEAKWPEIDTANALWTIPAARMKMRRDHIVPLCRQVVAILTDMRAVARTDYVFQGRARHGIAKKSLLRALRLMGYNETEMTIHGFRSIASTLLNEAQFPSDLIEAQLAHSSGDPVRQAYNRAQWLAARADMMQDWADYLDALRAGDPDAVLRPTTDRRTGE